MYFRHFVLTCQSTEELLTKFAPPALLQRERAERRERGGKRSRRRKSLVPRRRPLKPAKVVRALGVRARGSTQFSGRSPRFCVDPEGSGATVASRRVSCC